MDYKNLIFQSRNFVWPLFLSTTSFFRLMSNRKFRLGAGWCWVEDTIRTIVRQGRGFGTFEGVQRYLYTCWTDVFQPGTIRRFSLRRRLAIHFCVCGTWMLYFGCDRLWDPLFAWSAERTMMVEMIPSILRCHLSSCRTRVTFGLYDFWLRAVRLSFDWSRFLLSGIWSHLRLTQLTGLRIVHLALYYTWRLPLCCSLGYTISRTVLACPVGSISAPKLNEPTLSRSV